MISITDKLLDEMESKANRSPIMSTPVRISNDHGEFSYEFYGMTKGGKGERGFLAICESDFEKPMRAKLFADYIAAANPENILHLIKEIRSLRVELYREKKSIKILEHQLSIVTYDFDPEKSLGPPCGPEMLKEIMQTPAKIESAQEE